jgi:hypothetical protein
MLCVVAGIYAHASVAARKGDAPGEGQTLANRYADRAVDVLLKIRTAGFFDERSRALKVLADSDLAGLRGFPRFQTLLQQLNLPPDLRPE